MSRTRFPLRSLFVATAVAVLILAGIKNLHDGIYFKQVRTVRAALAEHPEIDQVWVCTNDDVSLEIEEICFTIVGDPGTTYGIFGTDKQSKSELLTKLDNALKKHETVILPPNAEAWRWDSWK